MKLGELEMRCGICRLLDESLCGEPYSEVAPCSCIALENMTEEEYIDHVQKIRSTSKRHWSNLTLERKICKIAQRGE